MWSSLNQAHWNKWPNDISDISYLLSLILLWNHYCLHWPIAVIFTLGWQAALSPVFLFLWIKTFIYENKCDAVWSTVMKRVELLPAMLTPNRITGSSLSCPASELAFSWTPDIHSGDPEKSLELLALVRLSPCLFDL